MPYTIVLIFGLLIGFIIGYWSRGKFKFNVKLPSKANAKDAVISSNIDFKPRKTPTTHKNKKQSLHSKNNYSNQQEHNTAIQCEPKINETLESKLAITAKLIKAIKGAKTSKEAEVAKEKALEQVIKAEKETKYGTLQQKAIAIKEAMAISAAIKEYREATELIAAEKILAEKTATAAATAERIATERKAKAELITEKKTRDAADEKIYAERRAAIVASGRTLGSITNPNGAVTSQELSWKSGVMVEHSSD